MDELCPNCGRILDSFGYCPQVLPEDAAIGLTSCRPASHPRGCTCEGCLSRALTTRDILEYTEQIRREKKIQ
jgi:hypothetical protein